MLDFPWFDGSSGYSLLEELPSSSSLTSDCIPVTFVKKIAHIVADPLAHIFNHSLCSSEVPLRWKHSFITPLLKKEPGQSVDNYRPVSTTSYFCRLFGKVLKKYIMHHLERNVDIIYQYGFIPVRIGSASFDRRGVKSGAPQGGGFSPIPFSNYTAELPSYSQTTINRIVGTVRKIQHALDIILEWSNKWNLPLAPDKTVYVRIGSSNLACEYLLGNHVLNQVSSVGNLGFYYDNKLGFSKNYESLYDKAAFRTFGLKGLTINDKEVLVKAYTRPYIRPIM
ncbi:hypothetical protein OSTOST_01066 [Ostertagia ostertagi]